MDIDLKKRIGYLIMSIIGALVPIFTTWFMTLGLDAGYIVAVDLILIETFGFIYYIIKKSFGIPIEEEPIVE